MKTKVRVKLLRNLFFTNDDATLEIFHDSCVWQWKIYKFSLHITSVVTYFQLFFFSATYLYLCANVWHEINNMNTSRSEIFFLFFFLIKYCEKWNFYLFFHGLLVVVGGIGNAFNMIFSLKNCYFFFLMLETFLLDLALLKFLFILFFWFRRSAFPSKFLK